MPKVTQRKDPNRRTFLFLAGNIKKRMQVEEISRAQICKILGITEKTFRAKMQNPEGFKAGELNTIFRILHFSDEEILECAGREVKKA